MIKIRIQGTNGKECATTALVDSWASENFIDKAYAEASRIPIQQKTTPRRVLTVDGSEVTGGLVTHDTRVHLTINLHEEDIQLHCITIGNAPIILGLPWLNLHNPVIGWKNHTVKFHSDHCTDRCLPSSPRANTIPEEKASSHHPEGICPGRHRPDAICLDTRRLDGKCPGTRLLEEICPDTLRLEGKMPWH